MVEEQATLSYPFLKMPSHSLSLLIVHAPSHSEGILSRVVDPPPSTLFLDKHFSFGGGERNESEYYMPRKKHSIKEWFKSEMRQSSLKSDRIKRKGTNSLFKTSKNAVEVKGLHTKPIDVSIKSLTLLEQISDITHSRIRIYPDRVPIFSNANNGLRK